VGELEIIVGHISLLYTVGWNAAMRGIELRRLEENLVDKYEGPLCNMLRRYDLASGYMGAINWMNKSDRNMLT
jgi:hypothetical protein